MPGKFELLESNGTFRFNLKAGNGQVILSSQGYTSKASAENGVTSVRSNAPIDERYAREVAKDGSPYFNLLAANGQIIGKSEMYTSVAARENGIASVKTNAPDATLVDATKG